jgi:hypothetical protein
LLHCASALQLFAPVEHDPEPPLTRWQDTPHVPARWHPQHHEGSPFQAYGLSPLPAALAAELAQYCAWATSLYTPNRPTRAKRRPVTMQGFKA